jgi:hypothetical protein
VVAVAWWNAGAIAGEDAGDLGVDLDLGEVGDIAV